MSRARICGAVCLVAYASLAPTATAIVQGAGEAFYKGTFGAPEGRTARRESIWFPAGHRSRHGGHVEIWCSSFGGHYYEVPLPRLRLRRERGRYGFDVRFTVDEVPLGEKGALPPNLTVTAWIKGQLAGSLAHPRAIRGTIRTLATQRCSQPRIAYVARYYVPPPISCKELCPPVPASARRDDASDASPGAG